MYSTHARHFKKLQTLQIQITASNGMITFTVYENITIESVSEENYVLWVFEVDVGSGEKVGIKAARRKKNEGSSVIVLW